MTIFLIYIIGAFITTGLLTVITNYKPSDGTPSAYEQYKNNYGEEHALMISLCVCCGLGLFWFVVVPYFLITIKVKDNGI